MFHSFEIIKQIKIENNTSSELQAINRIIIQKLEDNPEFTKKMHSISKRENSPWM